jgi:hypothetical protein
MSCAEAPSTRNRWGFLAAPVTPTRSLDPQRAWSQCRRAIVGGRIHDAKAEAAACGALIVPVVTGSPDWTVIDQMIHLVIDACTHYAPHPADAGTASEPPRALPPEAWQALLPAPFNTRSVPLDSATGTTSTRPRMPHA